MSTSPSGHTHARCHRCGVQRQIQPTRNDTSLCRDCRVVDPGWPDVEVGVYPKAGTPIKAQCGTDSGYFRHHRTLREPACDDCLKAHAEYKRNYLRNRRERAA